MINNENKIGSMLLNNEVANIMQELNYEKYLPEGQVVFLNNDPCGPKRVVIDLRGRVRITFQLWNDEELAPRWHTEFVAEMSAYEFAKITLSEWAMMLHLGRQVSFGSISKMAGLNFDMKNESAVNNITCQADYQHKI
jgi:hypothetical protein